MSKFADLDDLDREVLRKALREMNDGGWDMVSNRVTIMLDELNRVNSGWRVTLLGFEQEKKIAVIREIRHARRIAGMSTDLSLCKQLSENMPCVILENVNKDEAHRVIRCLEACGGRAMANN